ncbi:MAG: MFS transporter [Mogibacterium sp.]|nr:MFS transporter [Mogibacterium sp.]
MMQRSVLIAVMITAFVTSFMGSALNLSVPALESYFQINAALVSWIVSVYTISIAAMSLPAGKIADQTGRCRVFLTGLGGFGVLSVCCIFAWNFRILLLLRTLQGICAAMIFATNNAILVSCYPHDEQGRVIGYSTAAVYIGLSAGPVFGGILNSTFGWRSIFAVCALISAAAFLLSLRAIRGIPDDGKPLKELRESFDLSGAVLFICGVAVSLYGLTTLSHGPAGAAELAAGAVLLTVFFLHERRTRDPIMKVGMFLESRTFTFSNLAALLNYGATFAISYILSIYLQVILGIPSGRAGLLMIIMTRMQAALSPFMGGLSDRVRPALLASAGMGICTICLLLFSRLGLQTPLAYILGVLGLTGFGFAMFSSPNTNAILNCVRPEDFAVTNSIIATMRTYGQSAGMAVLALITSLKLGAGTLENSPKEAVLSMMHTSFLVFACICAVGVVFSLARDRRQS